MTAPLYDAVIPTTGRTTLAPLVDALLREAGMDLGRVVVVDDRRAPADSLAPRLPRDARVDVVRSGGAGPASARNTGLRATNAPWVVFVDDDVELPDGWGAAVAGDLRAAPADVGGSQARVVVPMTSNRPTDWERNVGGLADASWITAEMAYRRAPLLATGGFDERFPRAYREDADLALRVLDAGWQLQRGTRHVLHPVRPAPWWISITKQKGNLDDALMASLHGRDWRRRADAGRGRSRSHAAATACALGGIVALLARRRAVGAGLALAWCGLTVQFATSRIRPGPRSLDEVARMAITSIVIPPYATALRAAGIVKHRGARATPVRPAPATTAVDAVIVDRDGTIVVDVPYNGDSARVVPAPRARDALDSLRSLGLPIVVATNQSGIGRGILTPTQVDGVNARVAELLGPFEDILVCPHVDEDACDCRKPAPGLILAAAAALQTEPRHCVVIGDCAADIDAARIAGARSILVPNSETRPEEIRTAPLVADDLETAAGYIAAMVRS